MSVQRTCALCSKLGSLVIKLSGVDVPLCEDHWRELCELLTKVSYVRGSCSLDDVTIVDEGGVKRFKLKYEVKLINAIPKLRARNLKYLLRPDEVPENYHEVISEK
ncbi:MAG: hypothetical protein DRJ40_01995 [Thermoprotei archaeon]|nr:MAG: hypothetical protein DRJ40_01995 [Thermoprotei archaeon]